ncbi:hypothetical protein FQA39_LY09065 [Lamprigera yunnana]|nr:hypothetical protein FQA39_LY09065 [Lamprigera yunnana]
MYKVVCFKDLSVAIIREEWLTPRKTETFWPPYKHSVDYQRCLSGKEVVNDKWPIYNIIKHYYATDDLLKARQQLKRAECESDLNTDEEGSLKRKRKQKQYSSSDENDDNDAIEENQRKILEKVGNECSEPVQEVQNLPEGLIPCSSLDEIKRLENWLKEAVHEATLESTLRFLGGKNLKAVVHRVLEKIFSAKVVPLCNWTGKYQKTALKNLLVTQIIILVVRNHKSTSITHYVKLKPRFPIGFDLEKTEVEEGSNEE